MSYIVLARKWRPMSFDDLVGQEHVSRTLANAIESGRVAHAFLFTGVRGVGKTTSARILAKALNCMGDPSVPRDGDPGPTASPCLKCPACLQIAEGNDMDVREIDGASYNGVEEVRKLQDSLPYRPNRDRYKIFIVDEVHMLSQSAWNAFLKTLEEPPPHVKFIFATTEAHKVPVTILSRVQRFDFKLISTEQLSARLRYVLEQEKVGYDESAISILAREAAGSMRDAMSLLDQVIAYDSKQLRGEDVARVLGVASHRVLYELAEAALGSNTEQALKLIAGLADEGFDMSIVARDLLSVFRDIVVAKVCQSPDDLLQLAQEEREHVERIAGERQADDVLRTHQAFSHQFDDVVRSQQPRQALEMLLVRLCRRPPLLPVDDLIDRLKQLERRLAGVAPSGSGSRGGGSSRTSGNPAPGRTRPARAQAAPSFEPPARETGGSVAQRAPARSTSPAPKVPSPSGGRPEIASTGTANLNATGAAVVATAPAEQPSSTEAVRTKTNGANGSPRLDGNAALDSMALVQERPPLAAVEAPPTSPAAALDESTELFRRVVERVQREHPHLAAMLRHAVPLSIEGSGLTLGFERDSVFINMARTPEATQALQAATQAELGADARVSISDAPSSSANGETLARIQQRERDDRHRQAIERARQHPAVQKAAKLLGARIKSIKLPEGSE